MDRHLPSNDHRITRYYVIPFVLFLFAALTPLLCAQAGLPDSQNKLLQLTAAGHVLGFEPDGVYIAGGNHMLKVEFVGTVGVTPTAHKAAENDSGAQPLKYVMYNDLWPGVDLVYEAASNGIIESTWRIAPGSTPEQIILRYNAPVEIDAGGNLKISYETGWMKESAPIAWQEIDGSRVPVQVAFIKTTATNGEAVVSFNLGQYDLNQPLMIDPILEWNTFIGSADYNESTGIAVDSTNNIYVVGSWQNPITPLGGGDMDAFVAKLNSNGTLLWKTSVGGPSNDNGHAIVVDINSNVYISGQTDALGTGDAFAAMLLTTNGTVNWYLAFGSTTHSETGFDIAVDSSLNVFVTGESMGTWGTPLVANTGSDAFVQKLSPAGVLEWHTFLGGATGAELGRAITTDSSGNIYVAGSSGAGWGTPVSAHSLGSNYDAFVAKLNSSGVLQWNTFLGSTNEDMATAIAVDSSGASYVAGYSNGGWSIAPHYGGRDAFVTKLSTAGAFQWNSFFGTPDRDEAHAITVNNSGEAYITGLSDSSWGSPLNPHAGGTYTQDAFTAKLSATGGLSWNTFMGSTDYDYGYGIDIDISGNVYVSGSSNASWGVPLTLHAGGSDAFVAKICNSCFAVTTSAPVDQGSFSPTSIIVYEGETTTLTITAESDYTVATVEGCSGTWTGSNPYTTGPISTDCQVTATFHPKYTVIPSPGPASALISAGGVHSLVLNDDRTVVAWGANYYAQATPPVGLINVIAVSAGFEHSLALKENGTVVGWGDNTYSQLNIPAGLSNVVAVSAGSQHSLALKEDGTVVAWGANQYTEATVPAGLGNVTAISAGNFFSLALKGDGTVVAWGSNTFNQATVPSGLTGVTAISAGGYHSLALKSDGTVVAWGRDTSNQATVPTGLTGVVAVAAGGWHSLALKSDGTVVAWGDQTTVATGLADVVAISAGFNGDVARNHSLALKSDGTVVAWFADQYGQSTVPALLNLLPFHGAHGAISPNTPQGGIAHGSTLEFTVTPDTDYTTSITGTCNGTLIGNTYTTDGVIANCTVKASFLSGSTVSASVDANGSLDKTSALVLNGSSASFTLTPDINYTTDTTVGGDCPAGSWSGATYTTGTITGSCSVSFTHTIDSYTVGASVDDNGSLNVPSTTVNHNSTAAFIVTANTGYTTDTAVGGDCPAGSWSGATYTTGQITGACSVSFTHTIKSYTVSASVDANGSLDTSSATVNHDTTADFIVTPDAGYTTDTTVGGTCPAGSWSGSTYTTGQVTGACSVSFTHTIKSYTVSATVDANGLLNIPSAAVNHDTTADFIVTPDAGYTTDTTVGGTCPAGSWSGSTYTTGQIAEACSVSFTHTINSYTVSASVDTNGSLDTSSATVNHDTTADFIVTPDAGYTTDTAVGGTCPAGSWIGSTYTTGKITGACSVSFTHTIKSYTVTSSVAGANGSINPATQQTFDYGDTTTFTVTPDEGYVASMGGTCGGTLTGSTYTTAAITSDCTVIAEFKEPGISWILFLHLFSTRNAQ